jgi:hypothetical protein
MTPKGLRSERETVIHFDEEEETATIWTANGPMEKRFRKLGLEVIEEGDRHTVFKCRKSQVKIRRLKVLSADYKAKSIEPDEVSAPNSSNYHGKKGK